MVNKQENICDGCHNRVADRKCTLCQNDLCKSCSRHSFNIEIRSKDSFSSLGDIYFCKGCRERLKRELGEDLFDEEFKSEIANQISKYLVKKVMLENLK